MRIVLLLLFVVLAPASAPAQERDTVFLHGLASNESTWQPAADRLTARLAVRPYLPRLNWRDLFENQAAVLSGQLAPLPADVLAVGHSNGGIVAREWSKQRPVGGIVTLGSPNQGAPLVDHIFEWLGFFDSFYTRMNNVAVVFANSVDQQNWWWLPAQWTPHFSWGLTMWGATSYWLQTLGFDLTSPVLPEMRSLGPYMANLNSQANRDRESAATAQRVAVISVPDKFNYAGPMRMFGDYENWHWAIVGTGYALDGLAAIVRAVADVRDFGAFDLADRLNSAAEWFLLFEEVWCRSVSDPSPLQIGACYEHDGIVPAWSQTWDYPRVPYLIMYNGPVHIRETADSDETLVQALSGFSQVPPRVSPVPGGGSGRPPGRFKWQSSGCVWVANDNGPDQCEPIAPPTGRYKFDGGGSCYWEPNDYPPDQCSPPPAYSGRYKVNGSGGCYWDANDDGPDQCVP